jgi:hypothetical protein
MEHLSCNNILTDLSIFPVDSSTACSHLLSVVEKIRSMSSGHEETFCYEGSVDTNSAADMWKVILLSPVRLIW